MATHTLHRSQLIRRDLKDVFSFFEDPSNLAKITPPKMGFQILTPSPIKMQRGTLIDYVVHIMGLPLRWTSLITEYDPPYKFVDEQLKGPYSFWHHTHLFKQVPEGTLIEDIVQYRVPMGPLGVWLEPFLVRPQLNAIFNYRQKVISELVR
jgi:ligand-binding SRPBCC domain-containing protein